MLSIIMDIAGGYLVAKYLNNIWLALLTTFIVGIFSAVAANMLIYAFASDVFTLGEIGVPIASGMILHPVVTIVSLFVFRRRKKRISENNSLSQGEET